MSEQEEMARLWQTAPVLSAELIMDHGTERAVVDKQILHDHLSRLALYFFRGGVAFAQKEGPMDQELEEELAELAQSGRDQYGSLEH